MSEKRFNFHLNRRNPYEWLVFDGETIIVRTPYKRVATHLVNLLNSLYDENEQLRKQVGELQKIIDLTQYQLKVQDRILKEVGE